jgi:spore germination protein GerM
MQNNNKLLTLYYHQENTHRSHIKEHVKNLPEQKQKIFQKAIINFLQRPVLTRTDVNLWDNRIKNKIKNIDPQETQNKKQKTKDQETKDQETKDQETKDQEIEDQIIDQSSCSAFMGLNLFGCF